MTPFAKKVYKVVSAIPIGEVRTYKWVAKQAGSPKACRAVGQLMKNNQFPLIIPCHRVINCNGKIGGYVFGRNMKEKLLKLESRAKACLMNKE